MKRKTETDRILEQLFHERDVIDRAIRKIQEAVAEQRRKKITRAPKPVTTAKAE